MTDEAALMSFVRMVAIGDVPGVSRMIAASPELARMPVEHGATRAMSQPYFLVGVGHYLYAGDTPLHVAAAGHRPELVRLLVAAGSSVRARNRGGAEPIMYAADGQPASPSWNPSAQAATIVCLLAAGADPNVVDANGATPLHRAVRARCAAAVRALLDGGADPTRPNRAGSTPLHLASWSTGRGGSGSQEAKAQQAEIIRLLTPLVTAR